MKVFSVLLVFVISLQYYNKVQAQACFDSSYTVLAQPNSVNSVLATNSNGVYYAYSTGFSYYYSGSEQEFISGYPCYDICKLNIDTVYIATVNGLKLLSGVVVTQSSTLSQLSSEVYSVEMDKNFNIWAGGTHGLARYSNNGWVGLSDSSVNDIFTDTTISSKVYISNSSNIFVYDGLTLYETINLIDIDPNITNITCVAADKKGNIWIGTDDKGIYKKSLTGQITNYSVNNGYLFSNNIHDINFDKYGNLWASTNIGLSYYDGFKWYTFTTGDGLTASEVYSTFLAENGYIWVACNDKTIPINRGGTMDVQINDNNSQPVGEGKVLVELFYDHPLSGTGYDKFAEAYTDVNGNAHFNGLLSYDYYIKATVIDTGLLNSGLVNTYYGEALAYDSALTISSNCNNNSTTITLLILTIQYGYGEFAGLVKYHTYSKAAGEPVPGAEIIIEQEPNEDPVAMGVADEQGNYNIPRLETGSYKVVLEYPGIPRISSYENVEISSTNSYIGNLNFLIDTTVANGGAYADSLTNAPFILANNTKLNIYPNPTNSILNICFDDKLNYSEFNAEIFDLQGKSIYKQNLNSKENKIYIDNIGIDKGIYFIKIYSNENIIIKKIIYN